MAAANPIGRSDAHFPQGGAEVDWIGVGEGTLSPLVDGTEHALAHDSLILIFFNQMRYELAHI